MVETGTEGEVVRRESMARLPAPPPDRVDWPWTKETPPLPAAMQYGGPWPRISVITPSFNQGRFIEETIRSVLLQGYPNLEYIIIDGGSTDGTVGTIRRYEPWLAYWVSEADRGQSHAINKGMASCGGEVCGWLNSDDRLLPGTLRRVGEYFVQHPECRWLGGRSMTVAPGGGSPMTFECSLAGPMALIEFWRLGEPGRFLKQPSMFWRKSLWNDVEGLREELHLAMDHDLWLKFQEKADLHVVQDVLASATLHPDCKSMSREREQAREAMRCCYDAAERRGIGRIGLTLRMLVLLPAWRLSRCARDLRNGWWGGAFMNLAGLLLDPVRIWREEGRLAALRWRW